MLSKLALLNMHIHEYDHMYMNKGMFTKKDAGPEAQKKILLFLKIYAYLAK